MRQADAAVRGERWAIDELAPTPRPQALRQPAVLASPAQPRALAARRPNRPLGTASDQLQGALIAGDAIVVLFGFYMVIFSVAAIGPSSWKELLAQMIAVTTVGLVAIRSQKLWVARLNSVRAIELSRITRAVVLMGLGTITL